jgi:hypothetical protein
MNNILTTTTKKFNTPAGGGPPFLDVFRETLPPRPFCTDELGSLFIRPLAQAVKRRFIQPNNVFDLRWFVYDMDCDEPLTALWESNAPWPNFMATNPENNHAHFFYGLQVPVWKQPEARGAPLRYAASIDIELTRVLGADPCYGGLIAKNPLHDWWIVNEFYPALYDLQTLGSHLDLSRWDDRRKHLPPIGLGRNCTLFDVTRHWAYRQIRKGGFFNEAFFVYECTQYAGERNGEFPFPLPFSEVKATGKSVGKWTWRHMSPEGFREYQRRANKKSQVVRQAISAERADEIRAYKSEHPEASVRVISEKLGYSLDKISKALRG